MQNQRLPFRKYFKEIHMHLHLWHGPHSSLLQTPAQPPASVHTAVPPPLLFSMNQNITFSPITFSPGCKTQQNRISWGHHLLQSLLSIPHPCSASQYPATRPSQKAAVLPHTAKAKALRSHRCCISATVVCHHLVTPLQSVTTEIYSS